MDPREKKLREEHPDWTDAQVNAELARQREADPPPAPDPKPDPPAPDDSAFARIRREKEAAERRAKEAEDKLAEQARKEAEEQGRWKELAEQAQADKAELEAKWAKAEQDRQLESIARTLKFRDPDLVGHLVPASVDRNDTAAVKAALEAVAKERPHLVDGAPPPPSGGPAGGTQTDPPKLTREQLAAMKPEQVAALDPKVVNEALAG
jgi:seryl-tRNA synthetase